ncbi:UNVERIFIED_CONTAM: Retrovirus-related Pol polyprotein from transposon TNT 1-94 [Sesamum angustifolium]|uniref:Retrovirus-related Pol polyprotein from transposon TNT 1-94 n=1 Tax=Sesamum angustifolium TaxID=2727405 RepID=A0AAW2LJE5_9LAMI
MFNKVEGSKEDNQQGEEDSEENQPESENTDTRTETQNDISENIPSTHNYQLARDRDRRESRLPSRFQDFLLALNIECNEPSLYEEALESPDVKNWKNAMYDEITSLLKNKTWILVPKPENISIVDFYYCQNILALTAQFDWELKQMDVKTAFLHGDLDEQIYMCLPHWEALKWLLRYLNGSINAGIKFSKHADGVSLVGYVDSNYANDRDSRRSTTSYVFTLCGACISWKSQLQNIVALSTTEAKYIATTESFKEAIWLKGILTEIGTFALGPGDYWQ